MWTLAGMPTLAGYRDAWRWQAKMEMPMDLLRRRDGELLVVEMSGHRLRRVSKEGEVRTWVGGERGFRDGLGESARFDAPTALASDGSGGVYVSDTGNARIRRVSALGVVTTVAGAGRAFRDGLAQHAGFVQPQGLWRSSDGMLYIADAGAHRIRRLRPDGVVETWAGSGRAQIQDGERRTAGFLGPVRIVGDHTGRLFVTDMLGDALRQIEPNGQVQTPLRFPSGSRPFGLVWGEEWLYISLFGSHQIVRWRVGMEQSQRLVGSLRWGRSFLDGPLQKALFAHPAGLAWDTSTRRLLTVDAENHCVRVLGMP